MCRFSRKIVTRLPPDTADLIKAADQALLQGNDLGCLRVAHTTDWSSATRECQAEAWRRAFRCGRGGDKKAGAILIDSFWLMVSHAQRSITIAGDECKFVRWVLER